MAKRKLRLSLSLGLLALSWGAVGRASSPVVTSPDEYGQLCRRVNAVTGRSIQDIRSSLPELAGRYVEVCGKVLGLGNGHGGDAKPETVSVLLKSEDDTCFLPCPPDIPEIRPGRCVRMLLHLAKSARDISDCSLEGVVEHPEIDDEAPGAANAGKRLEIGEAAMGVRDRVPDNASGTSGLPTMPPRPAPGTTLGPAAPAAPTAPVAPGSALPPELRGLPTLSGRTGTPATTLVAPATVRLPARPQTIQMVATPKYSGEQVVDIWTRWVRSINPNLSPQEADLIVRWMLYYSAVNGVDHRLIFAVTKAESDFDPKCLSSAGAMGLTQLMPCNVADFKVKDPWDIAENIRGGVEHLAEFLRKYEGRSNYEQTVLALACYNAGPGAVAKYGGVPPYAETQDYVRKVPALFAELVKQGYP